MPKKGNFGKINNIKFDHYFGFTCLHFLFLLVFTFNYNKHGCNEREEEETHFVVGIIRVFVHACEACCGIQALFLQGEWEQFAILD